MRRRLVLSAAVLAAGLGAGVAWAADEMPSLPHQSWSFNGIFGTFDRAAAQRGFQVWKAVCSNCHSAHEAYYRNLSGIGLSPEQIAAVAAADTVSGGFDDNGQPVERPALPSDHFKAPFPNVQAARAANNGALPPDHSVIEKAREGNADYIYALLTGYADPPAGMTMQPGMNYNTWFPGHQIAMAAPLAEGVVTYDDGTPATVPQMARDVTTFLTYMANPELEQRKALGVKVVLFLVLMTGLTYAVKRKVWADVDH